MTLPKKRILVFVHVGLLLCAPHLMGEEPAVSSGQSAVSSEPIDEQRPKTILFDHGRPHHQVACIGCHSEAAQSRSSADDLRPGMSACASCHRTAEPKIEVCSGCHIDYSITVDTPVLKAEDWKKVRPAPMIGLPANRSMQFDHRRHLETASPDSDKTGDISCVGCHQDGQRIRIPTANSCTTCHGQTDSNPRFNQSPSMGSLPDQTAKPRSSPSPCLEPGATCSPTARAELPQRISPHPNQFLLLHRLDARSSSETCAGCHNVETFCRSCHTEAGYVPSDTPQPAGVRAVHPRNFDGAEHGMQARQDISACASCHTETDCVTCHTGVNPHPTDFRATCRSWLHADSAPCARCHTDLRWLREQCR